MNIIMEVATLIGDFAVNVCGYDHSETYSNKDHFINSLGSELDADGLKIREGLESLINGERSYATGSETFYISLNSITSDKTAQDEIIKTAKELILRIDHINDIQKTVRTLNKKNLERYIHRN